MQNTKLRTNIATRYHRACNVACKPMHESPSKPHPRAQCFPHSKETSNLTQRMPIHLYLSYFISFFVLSSSLLSSIILFLFFFSLSYSFSLSHSLFPSFSLSLFQTLFHSFFLSIFIFPSSLRVLGIATLVSSSIIPSPYLFLFLPISPLFPHPHPLSILHPTLPICSSSSFTLSPFIPS